MNWWPLAAAGIVAAVSLVVLGIAALDGRDLTSIGAMSPRPAVAVQPAPTLPLPATPVPGAACPASAAPLPPLGLAAQAGASDNLIDLRWTVNHAYSCGSPPISMACGLPPGDFLGWDIRWTTDIGGMDGEVSLRPESDPCGVHHYTLELAPRFAALQIRAVGRGAASGWSAPVYYPPDAGQLTPMATATPQPTVPPGSPTYTPPPPTPTTTPANIWAVAYDPDRGLPSGEVPRLPDTILVRAHEPAAGSYVAFEGLPHCAGSKRWRIVWPDSWGDPDRYRLVSPAGGFAPVTERSWERVLRGVEIQGVDYAIWRMDRTWDCSRVAGQTLRVIR